MLVYTLRLVLRNGRLITYCVLSCPIKRNNYVCCRLRWHREVSVNIIRFFFNFPKTRLCFWYDFNHIYMITILINCCKYFGPRWGQKKVGENELSYNHWHYTIYINMWINIGKYVSWNIKKKYIRWPCKDLVVFSLLTIFFFLKFLCGMKMCACACMCINV